MSPLFFQFHNMVMCCSAYMTVVLALERYRAVWRPVEYHNTVNASAKPWRRVMVYTLPVVIFSILFNLPKFFETEFEEVEVYQQVFLPEKNEVKTKVSNFTALVCIALLKGKLCKKVVS